MNRQGQIPRTRGGICGVLLILLGLWGGLAPFVGPYFHFGFTPDKAWAYNSGRLYYSVIPGAAALVGGILVTATRNRGIGMAGGVLAMLSGAWFVVGSGFVPSVLKKTISAGLPIVPAGAQPIRSYLDTVALFSGLGILVLVLGAIAVGRFSLLAARDLAAVDTDVYYPDIPSAAAATGEPSTLAPPAASQSPFEPAPFPDTMTAPVQPSEPSS